MGDMFPNVLSAETDSQLSNTITDQFPASQTPRFKQTGSLYRPRKNVTLIEYYGLERDVEPLVSPALSPLVQTKRAISQPEVKLPSTMSVRWRYCTEPRTRSHVGSMCNGAGDKVERNEDVCIEDERRIRLPVSPPRCSRSIDTPLEKEAPPLSSMDHCESPLQPTPDKDAGDTSTNREMFEPTAGNLKSSLAEHPSEYLSARSPSPRLQSPITYDESKEVLDTRRLQRQRTTRQQYRFFPFSLLPCWR